MLVIYLYNINGSIVISSIHYLGAKCWDKLPQTLRHTKSLTSGVRTHLSIDISYIMRSVLVAVRGVRGKVRKAWTPLYPVSPLI